MTLRRTSPPCHDGVAPRSGASGRDEVPMGVAAGPGSDEVPRRAAAGPGPDEVPRRAAAGPGSHEMPMGQAASPGRDEVPVCEAAVTGPDGTARPGGWRAVARDGRSRSGAWLRSLARGLAELAYPPRCAACDARLPVPQALCATCSESLEPVGEGGCLRCGVPPTEALGIPRGRCPRCRRHPPRFARARAPFLYGGELAVALGRLKFSMRPDLAQPLGQLLVAPLGDLLASWDDASTITEEARPLRGEAPTPAEARPARGEAPTLAEARPLHRHAPPLVVPVPLPPRRLRQREYNQALLLARVAARGVGRGPWGRHGWDGRVRVRHQALQRIRDTPSQVGRGVAARWANVADAFAADPRLVAGRGVVLVDDVLTTGATADACAAALLAAGARRVEVLTLMRAVS